MVRKELELNFTPVDEDLDLTEWKFSSVMWKRDARLSRRPEGNDQYKRIVDLAKNDEGFRRMLQGSMDQYC